MIPIPVFRVIFLCSEVSPGDAQDEGRGIKLMLDRIKQVESSTKHPSSPAHFIFLILKGIGFTKVFLCIFSLNHYFSVFIALIYHIELFVNIKPSLE